jgi:ribonuclease P protein subunit RPR2
VASKAFYLEESSRENMAKPRDKKTQRKVALERARELFRQAEAAAPDNMGRAHRYVALARKLAMRYNAKIPSSLQRKFCKHCYHYLAPGVNLRVRTHDGKVVYYCKDCKKYMRFVMKRKATAKKVRIKKKIKGNSRIIIISKQKIKIK